MEKKVDKRFYLLSSLNIITAVYLGQGFTLKSLVLIGFLVILVLNHATLINMVGALSQMAQSDSSNHDSKRTLNKVLFLFAAKMLVLGFAMAFIYFYKKELIAKLLILMIFQLIIQVLSIKNNYQIS